MERRRRYDLVHSKLPDFSLGSFATEADTDVRKLHSFGKNKPEINLYSGRAINFNGVDQNVQLGTLKNWEFFRDEDFTILLHKNFSIAYYILWLGSIDISIRGTYIDIWNGSHNRIDFGAGEADIAIVRKGNNYSVYKNGDLLDTMEVTEINHTNDPLGIATRAGRNNGKGSLSNLQIVKGALAPNKIKFYSDRQEDFLYRDNDVLKSKALTQDEIDNVVMFMPMCENDGFVRDYVNYSSTPFNTNTGENGFVSADLDYYHNVVADKSLNNDGSIRFQDNNANTNTPRFTVYDPAISNYKPLEANKYYLVKLKFKSYSDDVKVFSLTIDGDINNNTDDSSEPRTTYTIPLTTEPTEIMVKSTYGKSIGIIAYCPGGTSNKTAYFDLEYMIVTEVKGTYELKNYTASMNQAQLQTGLQTYKWERDAKGVPVSYDNAFNADKYNYATTNIQFNGKYMGIEAIVKLEAIDGSTRFMLCATPDDTFFILQYLNKLFFYPKYNNTSFKLNVSSEFTIADTYYHVYFELIDDGINATSNAFKNGTGIITKTLSGYTSRENNDIGKLFSNWGKDVINQGTVKLFNVYDMPQDPAELYAKRWKEGLLDNILVDSDGNPVITSDGSYVYINQEE